MRREQRDGRTRHHSSLIGFSCISIGVTTVRVESLFSEDELQRELADPRITGVGYHSEIPIDVARGIYELRVIEGVEELGAELQRLRFSQARFFLQRQIPIVDSGSVKEPAVGGSEMAKLTDSKK